ncbi:MAG: DUF374 domain-containing protein [Pirellulales bacterium]|nr:DUF374 domain-containing protein [Pirellulales bacterium]
MKIRSRTLNRIIGLAGATAIRGWMDTLEYRALFYDRSVDPVDPSYRGQKIYLFWHEYILFPLSLRGHCNLAMLLSRHHDAELLSFAARHLGFEFVRGSSSRGGVAALRELLAKSATMNLTITPDGPRGPRRTLAQGPIYLASKLQLPLVLLGLGFDRPWRLGSWDRFALPRPYSRARGVVSPPLYLPPRLDRDGIEHYRVEVERLLNRLTTEAELWAESGHARQGDLPVRREAARGLRRRSGSPMPEPAPWLDHDLAPAA